MKTVIFNENNRAYYIAKRSRLAIDSDDNQTLKTDARYVLAYGMDAYLKLYPDAIEQTAAWHERLLLEVERQKRIELSSELIGIALAVNSAYSKAAVRKFNHYVKTLVE